MLTNNKALVDICIITAGRFDFLEKCVDALISEAMSTSVPCHIYLLDNGSDAEERIEHNDIFSRQEITKVKRLHTNTGYPHGANSVIDMGRAPLVFFVTDDVVVSQGVIDKLVKRMDDPAIALCGLKLTFPQDSSDPHRPAGKVQHVGHGVNINGDITHPLVGWDPAHPKCNISRDVISVTGAVFMVRRAAFEKAGKFDESLGLGTYEDVTLALQLRRLGFRIFIDTECTATHYVGATAEKLRMPFPLQLNSMTFKSKWINSGLLQWDEWLFW